MDKHPDRITKNHLKIIYAWNYCGKLFLLISIKNVKFLQLFGKLVLNHFDCLHQHHWKERVNTYLTHTGISWIKSLLPNSLIIISPVLNQFALTITKTEILAEEVVLDVFTKLWGQKKSLSAIKNIETYLFVSVRNAAINAIKKGQKISFRYAG